MLRPMTSTKTKKNRWHCKGTLIPDNKQIEFWVADGCISSSFLPNCTTLSGNWICPGLVDGHVHISWMHEQSTQQQRKELVAERRETFASQGIIFVRDI